MYTMISSYTPYLLLYILICSWASCAHVHYHKLIHTLPAPLYPHLLMASCAHVHPHELMHTLSAPLYPHVILYISFIQFIRNGPLVQASVLEILFFLLYQYACLSYVVRIPIHDCIQCQHTVCMPAYPENSLAVSARKQ